VHECSLKKISLEDSFFKIIKGGEATVETGQAAGLRNVGGEGQ
jgi:hypothetical protein